MAEPKILLVRTPLLPLGPTLSRPYSHTADAVAYVGQQYMALLKSTNVEAAQLLAASVNANLIYLTPACAWLRQSSFRALAAQILLTL